VSAPVIAIDGPSGSGKGTIARRIRAWLGWHLLDSGALYRLVAWSALEQGVPLDDAGLLQTIARDLPVRFVDSAEDTHALLAGRDVSDAIRTERCGAAASEVAAWPEVRAALLSRQRAFQVPPGLVADGRDMGTVVFPAAELKIFLTASPDERARRRHNQLKEKGLSVNLAQLLGDIVERDRRDQQRAVAPLKPAADAILLDTTQRDVASVEEEVRRLVRTSGLA
jgi:CMP/dCMP kinase